MARTHHHRSQRRRKPAQTRPDTTPQWKDDLLFAAFLGMPIKRQTNPCDIEDYIYVDIGPGVRISHMDQILYEADDHAPGCVHVFRRNAFVMEG